jgi:hypothetical protein
LINLLILTALVLPPTFVGRPAQAATGTAAEAQQEPQTAW